MTFGATLGEHFAMAVSANMFHIAIDYKNKTNMSSRASITNIKIYQPFSKQRTLGGLDTNLVLNNA